MELKIINTKGVILSYIALDVLLDIYNSGHTLEGLFGEKVRVA